MFIYPVLDFQDIAPIYIVAAWGAYSKLSQVSKMELRFQLLTIFAKTSILDAWLGFECAIRSSH